MAFLPPVGSPGPSNMQEGPEVPVVISTLKRIIDCIRAFIADILSAIALGILFPINLKRFDPKNIDECDKRQTPILLIHGFLGSSNNWMYHRHRMKERKYTNIFTVNLGDPRKSIEDYAKVVADRVQEIQTLTGRKDLVMVCHSMGGLVAQQYLYGAFENKSGVKKIITIGTPFCGTHIAHLASWVSQAAREMIPGSLLIDRLQQSAKNDRTTQYYPVATKTDVIVLPIISALGGEVKAQKTKSLNATGHISYLFSPAAADEVLNALGDLKDHDTTKPG